MQYRSFFCSHHNEKACLNKRAISRGICFPGATGIVDCIKCRVFEKYSQDDKHFGNGEKSSLLANLWLKEKVFGGQGHFYRTVLSVSRSMSLSWVTGFSMAISGTRARASGLNVITESVRHEIRESDHARITIGLLIIKIQN